MSDQEYTPDMGWVRYCYSKFEVGEYAHAEQVIRQAQFDRWLNEQLAEAWDGGATAGFDNASLPTPQWQGNPYRPEES